jgi:bile salt-stimulated lipase
MTRWCKLVALVVGWSGAAGAMAIAQDAPAPAPPPPARWSLFKRNQAPAPPADPSAATPDGSPEIQVPPFPGPSGAPPVMPTPNTGAPPPPPFVKAQTPPAQAPPGPDRPPNGFSDPIPPDAENGF